MNAPTRAAAVALALALAAGVVLGGCSGDGDTGDTGDPLTVTVTGPSGSATKETVSAESSPSTPSTSDAVPPAGPGPGARRNPGNLLEDTRYGVYERVRFPAGAFGTTISDGTVTGTVNGYVLEARAGQVMTVGIESVESNAVFDVYAPDDEPLSGEGDQTFLLPDDGDYLVVVGSTRGNSSYDLTIEIRDSEGASPDLG